MNRICDELRNNIKIFLSGKNNNNKTASFILPNILNRLNQNTRWNDVINIDDESLSTFEELWESIGMDPFENNFEAKATFKIFFMFFHEALPNDIRNNQYVRVTDIRSEYGNLHIPPVDFNNPEIAARITDWLDEITADV
jgi:hypothetical protein